MKRLLAILLALSMAMGAAACGSKKNSEAQKPQETKSSQPAASSQPSTGPVTIEFWNGHTGPDGEVMKKLVKTYEDSHPGVKFNVNSMAWDDVFTKAGLAIGQGSGPDLVTMPADRMPEISDKIVKPLDEKEMASFKASDFDSSLWKLSMFNNKQYGVPLDTHPYVVYYRKDIFEKNKITVPNDKPLSKDEFISIAKKLTDKKAGTYGFMFKSLGVHAWWDTWPIFLQAGGKLWDDTNGTNPKLDSDSMIQAITLLKSFQGDISTDQLTDWQTAYSMFVNGTAAMIMHGSWLIPGLNKANVQYGTMMVPKFFDTKYASFANMHLFGFTKINDKRHQAAFDFVKWVETKENAAEWGKGSGNVPAHLQAREEYAKDPILKPIAASADANKDNLYMSPYVKQDATVIYKYIVPKMEALYKDKNADIKKAVTELNNDVKNALK